MTDTVSNDAHRHKLRFALKFWLVLLTIVLIVACLYAAGFHPLYQDDQGFFRGIGTKTYYYDSGDVMLVEEWWRGKISHGTWYRPNGEMIVEVDDDDGIWYYLHQNGVIRAKQRFNEDDRAEGITEYYDETGRLVRKALYRDGQKVIDIPLDAPAVIP